MVELLKNFKESQYEKQTFNLINVDLNETDFYHCRHCGIAVTENGLFCMEHKILFCYKCGNDHNNNLINCGVIRNANPVFTHEFKNYCVLVPIKKVLMKLNIKEKSND